MLLCKSRSSAHTGLSLECFQLLSHLFFRSRVYGEIVNTYETVMTKKFLHARTEAGRCTTAAVAKFCKVRWANPK